MIEIRLTCCAKSNLSGYDYWYITSNSDESYTGFRMSEASYKRMMREMGLECGNPQHLIEIAEWMRDNWFPEAKIIA